MTTDHICLDCKVDISDRDPQAKRCFDCAEGAQRDSKRRRMRRRMANPETRKKEEEYRKKGSARRRAKKRAQAFSKALGI